MDWQIGDKGAVLRFRQDELVLLLDFFQGKPVALQKSDEVDKTVAVLKAIIGFPQGVDYTNMLQ